MDREQLLKQANEDNKRFPQYKGHYDNWEVARVKRTVRGKYGLIASAGDYVLVDPTSARRHPNHTLTTYRKLVFVTIYSNLRKCDVSVRLNDLDGITIKKVVDIN